MQISTRKPFGEEVVINQYDQLVNELLNFGDDFLKCEISDDTGRKFLALLKAGKLNAICEDEFFSANNFTVKLNVAVYSADMADSKPAFAMTAPELKVAVMQIRDSISFIAEHSDFKAFLKSGMLVQIVSGNENSPLFLVTI